MAWMWNIILIYPFDVADDIICKSIRAMPGSLAGYPSRPSTPLNHLRSCSILITQTEQSSGKTCNRRSSLVDGYAIG